MKQIESIRATFTALISAATKTDISSLNLDSTISQEHPNLQKFRGVLLKLNQASQMPPGGAGGHRIFVSTSVAQKELHTLIGMGVDVQSGLSGHDTQRKVGTITSASIEGNDVIVEGVLWKKDFPEVMRQLKANTGQLGMSMELGNVWVQDEEAEVWKLERFHFTGAAILLKDKAAYKLTSLAAAAAASASEVLQRALQGGERNMAEKKKEQAAPAFDPKAFVSSISASVQAGVTAALEPFRKESRKARKTNQAVLEAVEKLHEIFSAKSKNDDGDASDSSASNVDDQTAAGDMADTSAAADDSTSTDDTSDTKQKDDASSDMSDTSAAADVVDQNEDATTSQGRPSKKSGKKANRKLLAARDDASDASSDNQEAVKLRKQLDKLQASYAELEETNQKEVKKLRKRVEAMQAQASRMADSVDRRSLSPDTTHLLEKNNVSVADLRANGTKLTVGKVDQILASVGVKLDPTTRATIKNELVQAGLMEDGAVNRTAA